MKAGGIGILSVGLVAGCVALGPPPASVAPRAASERAAPAAAEPSPAAARVTRRHRTLPAGLSETVLRFERAAGMDLPPLADHIAAALGAPVIIEERVPGEGGSRTPLAPPEPIPVAKEVTLGVLLDRIALRSGYEWEWEEGAGPEGGRLILYRDPLRTRAEGPAGWGDREEWRIEPVRHGTLRGVLEEWTARAGWTLVWEAEEVDYAVQAPAVFLGSFDAAVDALLRETRGRRMLVPTLWRANRYLTVREAG